MRAADVQMPMWAGFLAYPKPQENESTTMSRYDLRHIRPDERISRDRRVTLSTPAATFDTLRAADDTSPACNIADDAGAARALGTHTPAGRRNTRHGTTTPPYLLS